MEALNVSPSLASLMEASQTNKYLNSLSSNANIVHHRTDSMGEPRFHSLPGVNWNEGRGEDIRDGPKKALSSSCLSNQGLHHDVLPYTSLSSLATQITGRHDATRSGWIHQNLDRLVATSLPNGFIPTYCQILRIDHRREHLGTQDTADKELVSGFRDKWRAATRKEGDPCSGQFLTLPSLKVRTNASH